MTSSRNTDQHHSGSQGPEFLIIGKIIRPHGIRGEVAMRVMTAHPERLPKIETLYVGEKRLPHRVKQIRSHKQGMLLLLEGMADRDEAETLRGQFVYIHIKNAVPLEDGEYYLFQIEGIRVITDTGEELGHLTDLIETGANDVYVVTTPDSREILLPVIPEVIRRVDIPAGIMTVHLLEGLI
jgi:16S rRNA processing protein RimM